MRTLELKLIFRKTSSTPPAAIATAGYCYKRDPHSMVLLLTTADNLSRARERGDILNIIFGMEFHGKTFAGNPRYNIRITLPFKTYGPIEDVYVCVKSLKF